MSDHDMPRQSGNEQVQNAKVQEERGGRHHSRRRFQNQPRRPDPALNMDELRELVDLIAEHGFTEFELEREGFRVRLRRDLAPSTPIPALTETVPVMPSAASVNNPPTVQPQVFAPAEETPTTASLVPAANDIAGAEDKEKEDLHIITSPIVGTFYRAASPTAEPFVRVGNHVEHDSVVCIIEAMKLMNEIQAETSGIVEKIYVENGQPVEYGQPLFAIKK